MKSECAPKHFMRFAQVSCSYDFIINPVTLEVKSFLSILFVGWRARFLELPGSDDVSRAQTSVYTSAKDICRAVTSSICQAALSHTECRRRGSHGCRRDRLGLKSLISPTGGIEVGGCTSQFSS